MECARVMLLIVGFRDQGSTDRVCLGLDVSLSTATNFLKDFEPVITTCLLLVFMIYGQEHHPEIFAIVLDDRPVRASNKGAHSPRRGHCLLE